jgi:hypothetical protein
MQDIRFNAGPYDITHGEALPAKKSGAPVALQDLTEATLQTVLSALLEVDYLTTAHQDGCWPATGVLYGPCKRPVVCLPTRLGDRQLKNVFYLVDTGAPETELSARAFVELGADTPPSAARVVINGCHSFARRCSPDGNHPDIPVLGADFMNQQGLVLTVDYVAQIVSLEPVAMSVGGLQRSQRSTSSGAGGGGSPSAAGTPHVHAGHASASASASAAAALSPISTGGKKQQQQQQQQSKHASVTPSSV